jgi:hypothetical protein
MFFAFLVRFFLYAPVYSDHMIDSAATLVLTVFLFLSLSLSLSLYHRIGTDSLIWDSLPRVSRLGTVSFLLTPSLGDRRLPLVLSTFLLTLGSLETFRYHSVHGSPDFLSNPVRPLMNHLASLSIFLDSTRNGRI